MGDTIAHFVRQLLHIIWGILLGALIDFIRFLWRAIRAICEYCRKRKGGRPRKPHVRCLYVPSDVHRRPDPYLYSQRYLMSLGLAVTWDNPDIQLFHLGAPVPSHGLQPNTRYDVAIRIWNGSTMAPAPGLRVRLRFWSFGIGGGQQPVGETVVDLPVRGAPGHPTQATIPWVTPAAAGHYCLEAELIWPDDANPLNNVGQENTDVVGVPAGKTVAHRLLVTNDRRERQTFRLALTGYRLPKAPVDTGDANARERLRERSATVRASTLRQGLLDADDARQLEAVRAANSAKAHPPDERWEPRLSVGELTLDPGEARTVELSLTAPPGTGEARESVFTVSAVDAQERFVGGVTLVAQVR